jgi:hypothetical protein
VLGAVTDGWNISGRTTLAGESQRLSHNDVTRQLKPGRSRML